MTPEDFRDISKRASALLEKERIVFMRYKHGYATPLSKEVQGGLMQTLRLMCDIVTKDGAATEPSDSELRKVKF